MAANALGIVGSHNVSTTLVVAPTGNDRKCFDRKGL